MSDVPDSWRLEIEEVLEEIVSDPKAKLLCVPPIDKLLSLAEQGPVSVTTPDLTRAERYLLQTHRQELAFLLRERCVMEFYSAPGAGLKWHRTESFQRVRQLPTHSDWHRRARESCGADNEGERSMEAVDLLTASIRGGNTPGIAQLAAASQRLAPSNKSRLYLALDLFVRGAFEAGRTICSEVVRSASSATLRSIALENLAFGFEGEELWQEASEQYEASFKADPSRVSSALFWLSSSVMTGEARRIASAADAVDESVPAGDAAVDWSVRSIAGFLQSDREIGINTAMLSGISPRAESTMRILDAFQE